MSTVPGRSKASFDYGYREVRERLPDGRSRWKRVPLTLVDVLHPRFGDVHMLGDPHSDDCTYLRTVLKARHAGDSSVAVFSDCGIYWDIPGLRHHSPDLSVIFGVKRRKDWNTFRVREEGVRPSLIVEVTSPKTRVNDVKTKVKQYAQAMVPYYVIADVEEVDGKRRLKLIAYELEGKTYKPVALDERGRAWLEPVGLWLGVKVNPETGGDRVVLIDPDTDEEIGDYTAVDRARTEAQDEARQAQDEARQARSQAQIQAQRAEAEALARAAAEARRASWRRSCNDSGAGSAVEGLDRVGGSISRRRCSLRWPGRPDRGELGDELGGDGLASCRMPGQPLGELGILDVGDLRRLGGSAEAEAGGCPAGCPDQDPPRRRPAGEDHGQPAGPVDRQARPGEQLGRIAAPCPGDPPPLGSRGHVPLEHPLVGALLLGRGPEHRFEPEITQPEVGQPQDGEDTGEHRRQPEHGPTCRSRQVGPFERSQAEDLPPAGPDHPGQRGQEHDGFQRRPPGAAGPRGQSRAAPGRPEPSQVRRDELARPEASHLDLVDRGRGGRERREDRSERPRQRQRHATHPRRHARRVRPASPAPTRIMHRASGRSTRSPGRRRRTTTPRPPPASPRPRSTRGCAPPGPARAQLPAPIRWRLRAVLGHGSSSSHRSGEGNPKFKIQ